MKNIQTTIKALLFSLILTIGFISCSSDDDNSDTNQEPPTNKELLIGKWFWNSVEDPQYPEPIVYPECYRTSFYQFSTTTLKQVMYDLNADDNCEMTHDIQSPYQLIDDNIIQIIDSNGDVFQIIINSINENTLVLNTSNLLITYI